MTITVCLKVGIMFWALLLATCSSQFMICAVAYVSALGDSCCGVASLQLGFRWLDVRVVPRLKSSLCFKRLKCNVRLESFVFLKMFVKATNYTFRNLRLLE